MPEETIDYRQLLLQFCASLTLCDHMGDVGNDLVHVLKRLNIELPEDWEDLSDLGSALGRLGITTLYGTIIADEEEDDHA